MRNPDRLPAGGRYVLLLTKPAGKGDGWLVEVAEVGRSWGSDGQLKSRRAETRGC